jgi:hypothetical protein
MMYVWIWVCKIGVGGGWNCHYVGPYEKIPERFREDVALVDAADDKTLAGVGYRRTASPDTVDYYFGGWGLSGIAR